MKKEIKTIIITPNASMPLPVFLHLHRVAYFMEYMERVADDRVIWDESVEALYSEDMAHAEYEGMKRKWFIPSFEVPEELVQKLEAIANG